MITTKKTCFVCNELLEIDQFYKHMAMADGHLNKCIECTKAYERMRRDGPDGEKIRAYDRARGSRQPYSYVVAYRASNQDKYKAHSLVNAAIKRGLITKHPCIVCGEEKTEAHHPDYSSPLDVVWLCPRCHKQTHAMAKRIERKSA
jgi:hypothetical protein